MAKTKKIQSLPDETEALLDDVAEKVAEEMEAILEVLMPDGRPFGMVQKSLDEQVNDYVAQGFHDSVPACENKIRMTALQIIQMLAQYGVPPEQIATLRPYAIAEAATLEWSARMERLLNERIEAALRPTAVVDGDGREEDSSGY